MTIELVSEKDIGIGMLVEHHVKYREIHGEDETIFITHGEHIRLHRRLRREGKCKIPVQELAKISAKAQKRTGKYLSKHPNPKGIGKMAMKEINNRVKERVLNIII